MIINADRVLLAIGTATLALSQAPASVGIPELVKFLAAVVAGTVFIFTDRRNVGRQKKPMFPPPESP